MCTVQDRAQLQAVATRLVRAGASMEAADLEGRTALHLAAGCGDAAMVSHLLHLGAHVNAVDSVGGETTPCCQCTHWASGACTPRFPEAGHELSWTTAMVSSDSSARCRRPCDPSLLRNRGATRICTHVHSL